MIKFGPPFTITQQEIDLALDSLDQALDVIDDKFVKN
jgi:4-aminobutyrate aminotransferase-like enzyme